MSLHVEAVSGRRGVARFVDVPWHVYSPTRHPHWIPPLRLTVTDNLNTRKNPFYRKADIGLFLATEGGRVLGRIAAVENRWHNERFADRVGFFGFFECVNDADVAGALFRAAEGWLAGRGLELSRGPMNPSMNHECGLLVDGFDGDPVLFTPWNPPYYADLVEGAGYAKAKDLLAYHVPMGPDFQIPPLLQRHAERQAAREGITFRDFDFSRVREEAEVVWHVYKDAWADNWGFVPPDLTEFLHLAGGLRLAARPGFSYVAEAEGRPVGFMLILGDLNRIFKKIPSGRLTPWGLFRILWGAPRLRSGRVILLGFTPEARKRGMFSLFVHEAMRRGRLVGAEEAEASWVLEDNEALIGPMDGLGLHAYRRWRLYDKALSSRGATP